MLQRKHQPSVPAFRQPYVLLLYLRAGLTLESQRSPGWIRSVAGWNHQRGCQSEMRTALCAREELIRRLRGRITGEKEICQLSRWLVFAPIRAKGRSPTGVVRSQERGDTNPM